MKTFRSVDGVERQGPEGVVDARVVPRETKRGARGAPLFRWSNNPINNFYGK